MYIQYKFQKSVKVDNYSVVLHEAKKGKVMQKTISPRLKEV